MVHPCMNHVPNELKCHVTHVRVGCMCVLVSPCTESCKRISVAVCCSVLQCVAVCCSVLQCSAVCCSVLQCVAVCCSVLQCVAVCCIALHCVAVRGSVLQCVAVRYRVCRKPCPTLGCFFLGTTRTNPSASVLICVTCLIHMCDMSHSYV